MVLANWKATAVQIANQLGCSPQIVLATIEAETSGSNITGDNGHALGYGQVWPSNWEPQFIQACGRYGLTWPGWAANPAACTSLVLSNDLLSMTVAVLVIKIVWNGSSGNWDLFTASYVGPACTPTGANSADYYRRLAIWQKYQGSDYASYGSTSAANPAPSSGTKTDGDPFISIDTSNFEVHSESMQTGLLMYGRKYRVLIHSQTSNNTVLDVSTMRITFRAKKAYIPSLNLLELTIYNLTAETENAIIKSGDKVMLFAGYEGNQFGMIFLGNITWFSREKQNGTDYALNIFALDGFSTFGAFVNNSYAKGITAQTSIRNAINAANITVATPNIDSNIDNTVQLTRGKVYFGLLGHLLEQIADSQNAIFHIHDDVINFSIPTSPPAGEVIDLSPTSGLIGTPSQTEEGISFRCLINPQFAINSMVHIDNSLIRASNYSGPTQVIRAVDKDGIYRIIEVTFTGDTRGDDWYCDCLAVTQAGLLPASADSSSSQMTR